MSIEKIQTIIEVLKTFNARQLAVMMVVIAASIYSVAWIEDRYAKVKIINAHVEKINAEIQRNLQSLEYAQTLNTELLMLTDDNTRKKIIEKMKLIEEAKKRSNP
jgi:hypothetical protein